MNEWVPTTSSVGWVLRVGSFQVGTCGAASDTVTISKAQYSSSGAASLRYSATDSNPAAVLTVKVTSSGQVLGTMDTAGRR